MAGRVLVAASIKGGAGMSTLAACLAVHWLQAGRRVALLDCDPKGTLTRWHAKGSILASATLHAASDAQSVLPRIAESGRSHDVTIVDSASFENPAMVLAIRGADLVLIPVMADEASVYEAMRTLDIVKGTAAAEHRDIPACTVMMRAKRSRVTRHTRALLKTLGANLLKTQLSDRAVFQEASFHGSAPPHIAPASAATQEVRALAQELSQWRRAWRRSRPKPSRA